jgi:hypothetical protein
MDPTSQSIDFTTFPPVVTWTGWAGGNFGTTDTSLGTKAVVVPAGCNFVEIYGAVRISNQDNLQHDNNVYIKNMTTLVSTAAAVTTQNTTYNGATAALIGRLAVTPGTTVTFDLRANTSSGLANSGSGFIIFKPVAY